MLETLRNAWRVPELRKKLLYTFGMLLLFRLLGVIPVAGIDLVKVQESMAAYDALGLLNMMTGSAFSQMTIMAMGISPYINASIIMQLLTIAIPALERLQKEGGEEGRKKIQMITRYVTVGLAALQAIGIIAGLNVVEASYKNFFGYLTIGVVMAGGTALAMWIGERITKNGIGNGVSLLIFSGIIANLFNGILNTTPKMCAVEMCIHLRCGDALVPQQLLHLTDVSTTLQEMRSIGVAQRVWAYALGDSRTLGSLTYDIKHHNACQRLAPIIEE